MLWCSANATPTEEDIPQSPPPRHVKARPQPLAVPVGQTPDSHQLRRASSISVAPSADAPSPGQSRSRPMNQTRRPRCSLRQRDSRRISIFPYTIRSGDPLRGIQTFSGVQVADITHANRRLTETTCWRAIRFEFPPVLTRRERTQRQSREITIDKKRLSESGQATNALASLHSQLRTAAESKRPL